MNGVKVLLFGKAREIAGAPEIRVSAPPGATTASILETIVGLHPGLGEWKEHLRIAVNGEYADAERAVSSADEVALIPPVSGG